MLILNAVRAALTPRNERVGVSGMKSGSPGRRRTDMLRFTKSCREAAFKGPEAAGLGEANIGAFLTRPQGMALPRGFAPRASAFAERRAGLLHFGSVEMDGAPCQCCPDASGLEDRRAAVAPKTRCFVKVAAGAGIAPASSGLQPVAHLSEPSGVWERWSLRGVARPGRPVIGRVLCF